MLLQIVRTSGSCVVTPIWKVLHGDSHLVVVMTEHLMTQRTCRIVICLKWA
jgi:hypothetical protein